MEVEKQSDLNNFVSKFVGKDNTIEDAKGYHKSLFTAMNADTIAKHFYEQGKADAIKEQVAKDKNIDINPRQTHGEVEAGGLKFKVLGQSSSDMKNRSFKINKKR
jgi:ABC-type sulfate transport system substrate-binding protein